MLNVISNLGGLAPTIAITLIFLSSFFVVKAISKVNAGHKLLINNWIASVISIFVTLILIVVWAFVDKFADSDFSNSVAEWGATGDFFGGMLNPILAFASFIAVLYTLNIQSKQLEVSRKELEATRKELALSREAQQQSSITLAGQLEVNRSQKFYDIFYKMLVDIERFDFKEIYQDGYSYNNFYKRTQMLGRSENDIGILIEMIGLISKEYNIHKSVHEICGDIFIFVEESEISESDKSYCFRRIQVLISEYLAYLLAAYFNVIMQDFSNDGYVEKVFKIIKKRKLLRSACFTSTPSEIFIEFNNSAGLMLPISILGYEEEDIGVVGLRWQN